MIDKLRLFAYKHSSALTLVVVASVVFSIGYVVNIPKVYMPLQNYTVQDVNLTHEPSDDSRRLYPVLKYRTGDEVVPTIQVKCNVDDKEVRVKDEVRWRSLDPLDYAIRTSEGSATRKVGCETLHYRNTIPAAVKDQLDVLARNGQTVSKWEIQGTETPITDGNVRAVPIEWQSETFVIVYELDINGG